MSRDPDPKGGGAVGGPAGSGRLGRYEGRAPASQARTPAPLNGGRN